MAETEADESEIETCRVASEAAMEKGISYCDTPEARIRALSRFFGFDPDTIDVDEIRSIDTDDESVQTRKRVLARAEEIIAAGEEQPLDAINEAWTDVGADIGGAETKVEGEEAEQGPDHDESEEPEDEEAEFTPLDELDEDEREAPDEDDGE